MPPVFVWSGADLWERVGQVRFRCVGCNILLRELPDTVFELEEKNETLEQLRDDNNAWI